MSYKILMIDAEEEVYLQIKSLFKQIEGEPLALDWREEWDARESLESISPFDFVLVGRSHHHQMIQPAVQLEREFGALKSRFVSMASHEFRTPLTTIASSADLVDAYVKRGALDMVDKHIARIKNSVNDLNVILGEFLSHNQLEEGKTQAHFRMMDLSALVTDVSDECQSLLKPGQTIFYEHSGASSVYLDPVLLKLVLINLLSNAAKYSLAQAPIFIETMVAEEGVRVVVRDEGVGIPDEDQPWLFERFYRARNATNIQGTGMGLYLCKKYVELMGGAISLKSQLGAGTVFFVEFEHKANAKWL